MRTPIWCRHSALLLAVAAGGCAATPGREPAGPPPRIDTRVIAYPQRGQDEAQLDRDRYECHLWAVRQSRFDPSAPGIPEPYRVRVEPGPPPGAATVAGAIAGAVVGAAVSGRHDEGAGAVVGAVAGGAIGAASEQDRAERSRQAEARGTRRLQSYADAAAAYRRAISACLEGRGYTIR
ncbi:MAG: glycine zipper 2TM domain-containing protein [Steroidobacteraceae bacterium]